ncbi:MAG TPA: RNA-binding cell elongation regulator Jag/EloR [Mobilitalea sp.]|nr:RNA-binding cell elongation regulator Jag/EloR [Mobilitalea sp.]
MDWREFSAKNVDEALTAAMLEIGTTIENLEYEVIEKETSGFLGMFGKPARIKVRLKPSLENTAKGFLDKVFKAMAINAKVEVAYDEENAILDITVEGDDMGVLIGKRGQTLDSLQYLVSLVINKNSDNYVKVKLDTENYRARRKETLENLAKNIAFKVKRTRKPVSLEPMNPYERRIIHSALQNDKYVETFSEGEEPYRKVVINIKKTAPRDVKYNKFNKGFNRDTNKDTTKESKKDYHRDYNRPYNKEIKKESNIDFSKDSLNKNYSKDYKKDYLEYKESKEKKVPEENA